MLNETMSFEKKQGTEYEVLPENIYQVELLDVNLDRRPTYDTRLKPDSEKEYESILNFQFTLLSGTANGKNLRGRNVWENFVPTYLYIGKKNGKNKLYNVVEGLLGRNLTMAEEAEGITSDTINSLIGKQVRIGIKHNVKGDKTYDRIEQYYPVEIPINSLTSDEKEKATVKKKESESSFVPMNDSDEIRIEDIPFN
jgi:hypothetical protein